MNKLVLGGLLAIGIALAPVAISDEVSDSSSHHYVKESASTTKVKAKLAAKHLSTLTRIKINDEKGVVWLSGRAPTQDASDLAAMICEAYQRRKIDAEQICCRAVNM